MSRSRFHPKTLRVRQLYAGYLSIHAIDVSHYNRELQEPELPPEAVTEVRGDEPDPDTVDISGLNQEV